MIILMAIIFLAATIFNFDMFTSMVLLNISNMLMFLFNLSLPVVKTLKVHSENCCLVEKILLKDSIFSYFPKYREKDEVEIHPHEPLILKSLFCHFLISVIL